MAGRAVLFDLDDTLHDRGVALAKFVTAQHEEHRLHEHGIDLNDWLRDFRTLEKDGKVWKDIAYEELCKLYPVPVSPSTLLEEYVNGFARHAMPREGMEKTLTALREAGWRLGIVTNGPTVFQQRTLDALAVEPLVDAVVISEAFGDKKPSAAIFHHALKLLDADASNSWFVGDDPIADVCGAQTVGMRAIWFEKAGVTPPFADARIDSIESVLKIVRT